MAGTGAGGASPDGTPTSLDSGRTEVRSVAEAASGSDDPDVLAVRALAAEVVRAAGGLPRPAAYHPRLEPTRGAPAAVAEPPVGGRARGALAWVGGRSRRTLALGLAGLAGVAAVVGVVVYRTRGAGEDPLALTEPLPDPAGRAPVVTPPPAPPAPRPSTATEQAASAPLAAVAAPPATSAPVAAVAPPATSAPVAAAAPPATSAPVAAVAPPATSAPAPAARAPAPSPGVVATADRAAAAAPVERTPNPRHRSLDGKKRSRRGRSFDLALASAMSGKVSAPPAHERDPEPAALDQRAIVAGMRSIAPQVKLCYHEHHQKGVANLRVEVARSGRVKTVLIAGPLAGTRTAACLKAAVKAVHFHGGGLNFHYPLVVP